MLELNISFIFHLLCIAIGCQFLKFFFNKFYDNIIYYQNKENNNINNYNLENNILKEKTKKIQEELHANLRDVSLIIKEIVNNTKKDNKNIKKIKNNKIVISNDKKKLIDNYFTLLLKKIN